ncbi:hypothetical protein FRB95_001064 [Tulasnella sp. JGI-2019a]|nr:hypothetical protein FRB95_001064 [Tulasnella sp. JGI-2019a]
MAVTSRFGWYCCYARRVSPSLSLIPPSPSSGNPTQFYKEKTSKRQTLSHLSPTTTSPCTTRQTFSSFLHLPQHNKLLSKSQVRSMAAPKWLRVIVSWLARRRLRQTAQPHASGPRRRASFPGYQAMPSQQQFRYNQEQRLQQQYTGGMGGVPPHFATLPRGGGGGGHNRARSSSFGNNTGKPSPAPPNFNATNPYLGLNAQGQHVSISANAVTAAQYQTASNSPFSNAQLDAYRAQGLIPVAHVAPGQTQAMYYLVPIPNHPHGGPSMMSQVPAARPVTMSMPTQQPPHHHHHHQPPPVAPAPAPRPQSQQREKPRIPRKKSKELPRPPPPSPQIPFPPPPKITPVHHQDPQTPATPYAHLTPSTPSRQIPPPPPPRRTRISRVNSAPATAMPYNPSPKRVHDAYARYIAFWSSTRSPRKVTFESIQWPMVDPPRHPTSITVHAVRSFLLSPHHSQGTPARQRIESAQALWDPMAFWERFGALVRAEDRETIERSLSFLSGTLRMLHGEAVDAESMAALTPAPVSGQFRQLPLVDPARA